MPAPGEAVPWPKPEDLPYDPKWPLPRLGGHFKRGFNVVMADGASVFVHSSVSEQTLRAAITANGGEVVGSDWPDGDGSGGGHAGPQSKPEPERDTTVEGRVRYKGKPLTSGIVTFHGDVRTSSATMQADGTYLVTEVLPGRYKVTVTADSPDARGPPGKKAFQEKAPPGGEPPKRVFLPAKYANPDTTPLSVEVRAGKNMID